MMKIKNEGAVVFENDNQKDALVDALKHMNVITGEASIFSKNDKLLFWAEDKSWATSNNKDFWMEYKPNYTPAEILQAANLHHLGRSGVDDAPRFKFGDKVNVKGLPYHLWFVAESNTGMYLSEVDPDVELSGYYEVRMYAKEEVRPFSSTVSGILYSGIEYEMSKDNVVLNNGKLIMTILPEELIKLGDRVKKYLADRK